MKQFVSMSVDVLVDCSKQETANSGVFMYFLRILMNIDNSRLAEIWIHDLRANRCSLVFFPMSAAGHPN